MHVKSDNFKPTPARKLTIASSPPLIWKVVAVPNRNDLKCLKLFGGRMWLGDRGLNHFALSDELLF